MNSNDISDKALVNLVQIQHHIIKELIESVRVLGATSDLLSIVGSYDDTLTDLEVLRELTAWNRSE